MDGFAWKEDPAKMPRHDQAVFQHVAASSTHTGEGIVTADTDVPVLAVSPGCDPLGAMSAAAVGDSETSLLELSPNRTFRDGERLGDSPDGGPVPVKAHSFVMLFG